MHRVYAWAACGLGLLALAYVIASRTPGPTWDEHFNGSYLRALKWNRFTPEFLRSQRVSVGPGYFLFLRLFTDGKAIPIEACRWFSLGFLLALLVLLDAWVARERETKLGGWFFLGVPLITALAGYAMSDLMGLFLFLSALFLLQSAELSLLKAVGAGLLLGFATITRQVYLAGILLGFGVFVFNRKAAVGFLLAALLVPLPLFLAWHGFLPPFLAAWQPRRFSLPFLTLAFGEAAFVLLFFSPEFFGVLRRWAIPLLLPTALGMATLERWMPFSAKYVPLGWAIRLGFPSMFLGLGYAVLALTLFAGTGLFVFLTTRIAQPKDPVKRALWFVALALLIAPAFHTVIYSIRYVLAPIVLLLLLSLKDIAQAKALMVRWSLGVIAGLTVLAWQTRAL